MDPYSGLLPVGEGAEPHRGALPVREGEIVSKPLCTPGNLPAEHGALAYKVLQGEEYGDVTGYAEDHL